MPVTANDAPPEVIFGWLGNPGDALGGMGSRGPRASMFRQNYRYSDDLSTMHGVSIPVWSSGSFTSRWRYRGVIGMTSSLAGTPSGQLEGTLTMPPDLELKDCVLAYRGFAFKFNSLSPGETQQIRRGDETGLAEVVKDGRISDQMGRRFDPTGLDTVAIVRRMLFFKAADGERSAGMYNGYQAFTDLSGRLDLNRAILVGQAKAGSSAAQLLDNGQPLEGQGDRHWVFCRFVLPVTPLASVGAAPSPASADDESPASADQEAVPPLTNP
jgi:hypothetical protein